MTYKCLIADDEKPARELMEAYVEQVPQLEIAAICQNGLETVNALREHSLDILFLDIQMPQLKGTEVVPLIRDRLPVVIFTTAYEQYALDAFNLDAIDYLLKPFGFDRFIRAVDKAMEKVSALKAVNTEDEEASFMMVKSEYKLVRINFNEITFIEAFREYVRIYMDEGDVLTLDTMKNMESLLPSGKFCRIHKSYIASLEKIKSLQGNQVEIADQKLPIGRSYKGALMEILKAGTENSQE